MKKTPHEFAADLAVTDGIMTRRPTSAEIETIADAITGYLEHIGIGVIGRPHEVGDRVRWTSSGTPKSGEIVAIVPPGVNPEKMGYKGGAGMSRAETSFLVKGRRLDSKGKPIGTATIYWPLNSLLKRQTAPTTE